MVLDVLQSSAFWQFVYHMLYFQIVQIAVGAVILGVAGLVCLIKGEVCKNAKK